MDFPGVLVTLSYDFLGFVALLVAALWFGNSISYRLIKDRVLKERIWDYNICCGTTDGGGINADIVQHGAVKRFEIVEDVTALPHPADAFDHVLCSHTLEHIDDPEAMFEELCRVGRHVTVLVPPLWDLAGALNPFEHRVIYLTLHSRHENRLPRFVRYTPGRWIQRIWGQRVRADSRDAHRASDTQSLNSAWVRAAPMLVPVLWLLAAVLLSAESEIGFAVLPLATFVLWRTQTAGSS